MSTPWGLSREHGTRIWLVAKGHRPSQRLTKCISLEILNLTPLFRNIIQSVFVDGSLSYLYSACQTTLSDVGTKLLRGSGMPASGLPSSIYLKTGFSILIIVNSDLTALNTCHGWLCSILIKTSITTNTKNKHANLFNITGKRNGSNFKTCIECSLCTFLQAKVILIGFPR